MILFSARIPRFPSYATSTDLLFAAPRTTDILRLLYAISCFPVELPPTLLQKLTDTMLRRYLSRDTTPASSTSFGLSLLPTTSQEKQPIVRPQVAFNLALMGVGADHPLVRALYIHFFKYSERVLEGGRDINMLLLSLLYHSSTARHSITSEQKQVSPISWLGVYQCFLYGTRLYARAVLVPFCFLYHLLAPTRPTNTHITFAGSCSHLPKKGAADCKSLSRV